MDLLLASFVFRICLRGEPPDAKVLVVLVVVLAVVLALPLPLPQILLLLRLLLRLLKLVLVVDGAVVAVELSSRSNADDVDEEDNEDEEEYADTGSESVDVEKDAKGLPTERRKMLDVILKECTEKLAEQKEGQVTGLYVLPSFFFLSFFSLLFLV